MHDEKTRRRSKRESRRDFLKGSATVAGAAGVLAVSGVSDLLASTGGSPKAAGKIPLKIAGYKVDRVEALIDGRVQVEGCDAQFEIAAVGDMNTDVFSGS